MVNGFKKLLEDNPALQERVGCPVQGETGSPIVEQLFQNGGMIWFQQTDVIFVFIEKNGQRIYQTYSSERQQGSDTPPPEEAPEGMYKPVRGFGTVWGTHSKVRELLGWAVGPEISTNGASQWFDNAQLLWSQTGMGQGKRIYVLFPNGIFQRYPDMYNG